MDLDIIKTLIGDIGFPIVACAFMYKMNVEQRQSHKEESDAMRKVLDNNSTIVAQLKAEIETFFTFVKKEDKNNG